MKLNEWINEKFWQSIFTCLNVKNEYSLKTQRSHIGKLYLGRVCGKAVNLPHTCILYDLDPDIAITAICTPEA